MSGAQRKARCLAISVRLSACVVTQTRKKVAMAGSEEALLPSRGGGALGMANAGARPF